MRLMAMVDILNEIKRDYVRDVVKRGKRIDERKFDEYRKITVETGIIPNAEGSAKVKLGNSQVLVGVKLDIGIPYKDRPTEGIFSTSSELLPLASPTFEPGPPSAQSIELARVVDRGIRSSGAIDMNSLFIEENKVWAIFTDVYALDHDGNLIDAAALAGMAALLSCRMPKYEDGKIIRTESSGKLPVSEKVATCTFAKINGSIVLDPSFDEEVAMDCRLTLSTTPTHLCASQKGGSGAITEKELLDCLDTAFRKGSELRALLKD